MDDNSRHIHPEAAQTIGLCLHKTAEHSEQYRNTGGRRHEVLNRQSQRLRQIAQCGFAAVRLPVGIGYKADGCIERQIPLHARQSLRISWKHALQKL